MPINVTVGHLNMSSSAKPVQKKENENKNRLIQNRIIFGAPGTGKSYALKCNSDVFANQKTNSINSLVDIKNAVQIAILQKGRRDLMMTILGLEYYNILKEKDLNAIKNICGSEKVYYTYIATLAKPIADSLPIEEGITIDFVRKTFSDEQKKGQNKDVVWATAIGVKYWYVLSEYSTKQLVDLLDIPYHKADDIHRGAIAENLRQEKISDVDKKEEDFIERLTFHPNYSYAQFVGTYKPIQDDEDPKSIVYSYVPGPFMRTYVRAKRAEQNKTDEKFLLIIEEINRANVAAVFGDVFQLLDRKNGVSEYPIAASEDIKRFLRENGIQDCNELKIPSNMYIWATMNSADQGVFPMDTAFKRRWEFEYIGVNDKEDEIKDFEIPMQEKRDADGNVTHEWMKWNDLRTRINDRLTDCGKNEDKLLGPFFISMEKLESVKGRNEKAAVEFVKSFKSKVLMYLFEDVCKMRPGDLFKCDKMRYSEICKKFDTDGIGIFNF